MESESQSSSPTIQTRVLFELPLDNTSYYCIMSPMLLRGSFFWVLAQDSKYLSSGVCASQDAETMLNALRTDLSLSNEGPLWRQVIIH